MFARLKNLINNLVSVGTISQTQSSQGKSLARVKIGDRETDFLPACSIANSFFKVYSPIRVGEQVLVLSPFGEPSSGIIIRSIFNKNEKEPSWANNKIAGMEFEDGTVITYDTDKKLLKFNCVGDIYLKAGGKIIIESSGDINTTSGGNINTSASGNIDMDATRIDLN